MNLYILKQNKFFYLFDRHGSQITVAGDVAGLAKIITDEYSSEQLMFECPPVEKFPCRRYRLVSETEQKKIKTAVESILKDLYGSEETE